MEKKEKIREDAKKVLIFVLTSFIILFKIKLI